jgi:GNAT superfamily N-acetyltransferase
VTDSETRVMRIRDAAPEERAALETLQRRSSDVWDEYREQLAAHPDAIELPDAYIGNGWVRVAVDEADAPIAFSVVIPAPDGTHELDGLFVAPERMHGGIGRALVDDAAARARAGGANTLQVIAGRAQASTRSSVSRSSRRRRHGSVRRCGCAGASLSADAQPGQLAEAPGQTVHRQRNRHGADGSPARPRFGGHGVLMSAKRQRRSDFREISTLGVLISGFSRTPS